MSALKTGPAAALAVGCALCAVISLAVAGGSIDEDDKADPAGAGTALAVDKVPTEYLDWIVKAGQTCADAPAPLIAAQIEAESGWNPNATSPAGAQGLSQFMPGTWKTWGVDADSDGVADPFSAPDAIMTQARYDCWLAGKVKSYKIRNVDTRRLMLAAYNAGPGAVQQWRGIPPYTETQQYISRILQLIAKYSTGPTSDEGTGFGARVVAHGQKWLGTPYSWGGGGINGPSFGFAQGATTRGFDCSSLVQYAVYHASGGKVLLPRTSQQQVTVGQPVSRDQLRVGDVIGFALNGAGYDHIAIYIGDGQILHAPRTGRNVSVDRLTDGYYASKPQKIRRYG